MNTQISAISPDIIVQNGRAVTTSVSIAGYFHKTHDNVLKKIRSLIAECEPKYHLVNFNEVVRDVPGGDGAVRKMPMFELTRDAFVLIVMGFTGKKALQWKIDYINAFNCMEKQLRQSAERRKPHAEPLAASDLTNIRRNEEVEPFLEEVRQEFLEVMRKEHAGLLALEKFNSHCIENFRNRLN